MFACPFLLFAKPFEGLGLAADVGVFAIATLAAPTAPIPTVSSTPVSAIFTASVSAVPSVHVSVLPTTPIITGPGELSLPLFLSSSFFFFFFFLKLLVSCLVLFDRSSSYGILSV